LKEYFGAPAENVNFGAEKTRLDINKWVEDFTHQKIKELLPGGSILKFVNLKKFLKLTIFTFYT